jgi:ribosomal-protein-alanine N-acetyltransferase
MTVLHTERLILRPIEDSDLDPLYEIQGDRDHMRLTFWAESRAACEGWLRRYESLREVNGFAPWTTVNREDGRVIGWGGLNTDPNAQGWGVEVSYFIHPSYEGRGFATEIVRASLRYGFAELALRKIGAFAKPENHASIRVLEKCGFRFLRYEPVLARNHYEVRREDWSDAKLDDAETRNSTFHHHLRAARVQDAQGDQPVCRVFDCAGVVARRRAGAGLGMASKELSAALNRQLEPTGWTMTFDLPFEPSLDEVSSPFICPSCCSA